MKLKKVLTGVLMMLTFSFAQSQERDFDGIWTGTLKKDDGTTFSKTLYIESGKAYMVTKNEEGKRIKELHDKDVTTKHGEQLNFLWMNTGGVWTETQSYSLVWISKTKLAVLFFRNVSNEDDVVDDNVDNTNWNYTATGYLYKE